MNSVRSIKKPLKIFFVALISLSFCQCSQKSKSEAQNQKDSLIVENKIESTLEIFGSEILYNRQISEGVNAATYQCMQKAYPNDSYTDLLAKIEQLPNNRSIQDNFLRAIIKSCANQETIEYFIYTLCKDAHTSQKVDIYYKHKFPELISDKGDSEIVKYRNESPPKILDTAVLDQSSYSLADVNQDTLTYEVKVQKSYFHELPNETSRKRSYLINGDVVKIKRSQGGYFFIQYKSATNQIIKGWLAKEDLQETNSSK